MLYKKRKKIPVHLSVFFFKNKKFVKFFFLDICLLVCLSTVIINSIGSELVRIKSYKILSFFRFF